MDRLLYSEALHRQKKALLCHVLVAVAMCFQVFNIIEQEGIQCVRRILQLLLLFMYKLVLPSSFRQQMVLPPLWKQTQTSLQFRESGKNRWEQIALVFSPWPSLGDWICSQQGRLLS